MPVSCDTFRTDSSVPCPVSVRLSGSSKLVRFTAWKARPKIVLSETNHQFFDETDLGLVLLPTELTSPSLVAPTSPRLPTQSPLRC